MMKLKCRFYVVLATLMLGSVAAHAEHSGAVGTGRPVLDNGASQVNFVNTISACLQGRVNLNSGIGAGLIDSPGGFLPVGPPAAGTAGTPGATGGTSGGAVSAGAAAFMPGGRCVSCHAMKPAAASINAVNAGRMPPNATLSAQEKSAILTFLTTGR